MAKPGRLSAKKKSKFLLEQCNLVQFIPLILSDASNPELATNRIDCPRWVNSRLRAYYPSLVSRGVTKDTNPHGGSRNCAEMSNSVEDSESLELF